jgi:hypothetical protein
MGGGKQHARAQKMYAYFSITIVIIYKDGTFCLLLIPGLVELVPPCLQRSDPLSASEEFGQLTFLRYIDGNSVDIYSVLSAMDRTCTVPV